MGNTPSGGNSKMTLENEVINYLENELQNYTEAITETTQNVTQSYIDNVQNNTSTNATINQFTSAKGITITDDGEININKRANITGAVLAQTIVSNNTTDRNNLASVMENALKQSLEAQADLDTSQKAINIMEQSEQNNGGIEGMFGKLTDMASELTGGNNTEQDILNSLTSTMKQKTINSNKVGNIVSNNINKSMENTTFTNCKTTLNISQITELENITVTGRGKFTDEQIAAIDSTTECFNEVFNIKNIQNDISSTSTNTVDQTLKTLSELKSKQDTQNKQKTEKIQKNLLDSILGGGNMMMLVIVVVVIIIIMGVSGGGGGGGRGGGRRGIMMGTILPFLFIILIIIIIIGSVLLILVHSGAVNGSELYQSIKMYKEQLYPSNDVYIEKVSSNNSFKIYIKDNKDKKLYLTADKNHYSEKGKENEANQYISNIVFKDAAYPLYFRAVKKDDFYEFKLDAKKLGIYHSDKMVEDTIKRTVAQLVLYDNSNDPTKIVFQIIDEDGDTVDIDNIGSDTYRINCKYIGDNDYSNIVNDSVGILTPEYSGVYKDDKLISERIIGSVIRFTKE